MSNDMLTLSSDVSLKAARGRNPVGVTALVYGGGILALNPQGDTIIDLTGLQLPSTVPILGDHRNELDSIIGTGTPSIGDNTLMLSGTLADSEQARKVLALAKSGVQLSASVGASIVKAEMIRKGDSIQINGRTVTAGSRGLLIVHKSQLKEISLVAVGADGDAAVQIAAKRPKTNEEQNMNTNAKTPEMDDSLALVTQERDRVASIINATRNLHGVDSKVIDDLRSSAISEGMSVEDVQSRSLELLRASYSVAPQTFTTSAPAAPGRDIMAAAVLAHMGKDELAAKHFGERAAQQARDMHLTSMVDVCRVALRADCKDVPHGQSELIRAAFSTVSLPVALGDAAHKTLLSAYMESPATWRSFSDVRSVTNFKENHGVRPSAFKSFAAVAPGGEIHHGELGEADYTFSASTFGQLITLDRRDIINDDLSVFDENARNLGRAASRSLADEVYGCLLANSGNYFHANNNNLATGGSSALDATSLGVAIAAMMGQRDADGHDLDIRPRMLLVPPELRQTAIALLESDFLQKADASNDPTGNPLRNSLSLQVEPRLSNDDRFSGTSTTAWYVFGSPSDSAMVTAFLQGKMEPTIEFFGLDSDPRFLAASWRVYFDYGCSLADPVAGYKADGA